jgi:hypothetical protein
MPLSALCVVALALAPGQAGKLELSNIRGTYGLLGPARPDLRILPGEVLQVAFDIAGLTPDNVGRLRFAAKLSVKDAKGESVFQEDLGELPVVLNVLGGGKVPHAVIVNTGLKQAPGQYQLQVTVTDLNGKKEGNFSRDFTILPLEFGLVRFQLCYDRFGQLPAPGVAAVGQTLYVNAVAVGYKFDMKDEQASLSVEMSIRDEQDKPVSDKPLTGEFKNIANDTPFLPFRFDLPVHRAGRFRLVLKATDNVAKKTTTFTVPLLTVEQK